MTCDESCVASCDALPRAHFPDARVLPALRMKAAEVLYRPRFDYSRLYSAYLGELPSPFLSRLVNFVMARRQYRGPFVLTVLVRALPSELRQQPVALDVLRTYLGILERQTISPARRQGFAILNVCGTSPTSLILNDLPDCLLLVFENVQQPFHAAVTSRMPYLDRLGNSNDKTRQV
jgi:hypothetical protein